MRPVLKPALRPIWRDDATLQFGVDPRHAVRLDHVDAATITVLTLLDGTRDSDRVIADAAARGVPTAAARALLSLLGASGALEDAATQPPADARHAPDIAHLSLLSPAPSAAASAFRRRAAATVVVVGAGRVGAAAAALLAAGGVGRLRLRDPIAGGPGDASPTGGEGGDPGRPRVLAAAAAATAAGVRQVDAAARAVRVEDCFGAELAIVVTEPYLAPPAETTAALESTATPYLVAGVRETTGIVGPLVHPGRTSCARCHDHARAERDPAWPVLAAQLAQHREAPQPCDITLATATAALAAGQALAYLAGPGPVMCVDATLELRLPEWSLRRRTWVPHPTCACRVGASRTA